MGRFFRAKQASVPSQRPRFLVKFPRVGKVIKVKCPTYARDPPAPSGLTLIDGLAKHRAKAARHAAHESNVT